MNELMFRFQVTVPDVYAYCMVTKPSITTLASHKNEVSGFVKESEVDELKKYFEGKEVRLIESKEYWKNYEKYN